MRRSLAWVFALWCLGALVSPLSARAQERVYHSYPLPAEHNWAFRDSHPAADRLINAFAYGHGILYETLWSSPEASPDLLETEIYARLVEDILVAPPRLPMPEAAFMPNYARLVPLVREMFEWAHMLHRQVYDILADPDLSEAEQDAAMERLLAYYLGSDLAFRIEPKGMEVMDGQFFSMAFRDRNPKFNGLIWAYHWLQIGIHEPLLSFSDPAEQHTALTATLARFWQMVAGGASGLPSRMPMAPAIAPTFTARYPRFAAIFDNLHMMHDVISDILVSDQIPREQKRAEIYRQAEFFRDPTVMTVSPEEWIRMANMSGVDAQGGPALGLLPEPQASGNMPMDMPMRREPTRPQQGR